MPVISRRNFMLGSGAALSMAPFAPALAASAHGGESLVLVSQSLVSDLGSAPQVSARQKLVVLDRDVVDQSRQQLATDLSAGVPVSGVTDWADYVVMMGVARDNGYRQFPEPEAMMVSDLPGQQPGNKQYFRWHFS